MKTQINTKKFKTLKISVWLVNKGNFNDERLIANKAIPLSELKDKEPVIFNPFLDKFSKMDIKVSLVKVTDELFTYYEVLNNKLTVREFGPLETYYITDSYNDSSFLVSKVDVCIYE